jgi:hypothetical protein
MMELRQGFIDVLEGERRAITRKVTCTTYSKSTGLDMDKIKGRFLVILEHDEKYLGECVEMCKKYGVESDTFCQISVFGSPAAETR